MPIMDAYIKRCYRLLKYNMLLGKQLTLLWYKACSFQAHMDVIATEQVKTARLLASRMPLKSG